MFLAIKEMKKEKARFAMIISVAALIAYLVYFLTGLAFGLAKANTTSVDQWDASGIILSKSANQNVYSSSIDQEAYQKLGLENSHPINVTNTVVGVNGQSGQFDLVFMGIEQPDFSLVSSLVEGREIKNEHEIVMTKSFKELVDVKLNDKIKVIETDREFTIVGFSEVSEYNTQPVAYAELDMVSKEMMMYRTGEEEVDATTTPTPNQPNRLSGIIVEQPVKQKTLNEAGLEYLSLDEFINAIPGYQAQVLTFGLMIISLVIIASVIIGIFMYILTMQKKSIFGILKIQGINNGYISKSVIFQTVIISIIGLALGLLLTVITFAFLPVSVPVKINWTLYGVISLLSVICSLVGTVFSAKSILKIDPLNAL